MVERWKLAFGGFALLAVWLLVRAMRGSQPWSAGLAASVAAAVALLLMLRARGQYASAWRRAVLYDVALERVSGEKPDTGATGEAFARSGHLFQYDLNVIGKDSLFARLATTRTAIGQRGLAAVLLDATEMRVARERQAAVQELAGRFDLRERVALLGRSKLQDVPVESFERWLSGEDAGYPRWLRPVLACVTLGWIALAVSGLLLRLDTHLLLRNLELLLAVQMMLCARWRRTVNRELEAAQQLVGQTEILREGLRLLREESFSAALLQRLQGAASGEDRALAQLERWLSVVEQRPKEWFYPLSLATAMGTQAAMALERWRGEHGAAMRVWLGTWAEFEAMLALATYAAEHESDVYPELLLPGDGVEAAFAASELRHPLLRREVAVANDVTLDAEQAFLLISGSNMAGKSTLLRAMGMNAVLALAGAPVAAAAMRLSVDCLGASLAVSDSLAEGKSKFLAEVERLREIVTLARTHPARTLFLIDEILAGTNSLDRRAAAESVVRALMAVQAVGALSTHDLTLTEIAEMSELRGHNVHMASPHEDDPLAFDYLLKPGINRTANAMAIVRMMGLA